MAKVTDLITVDPGQGPVNQAAATVAQTATDIRPASTGSRPRSRRAAASRRLRAKLASTADTMKFGITLGAVGTILLLIYVAFLHWVLFRHSGERRKRGPSNTTPSSTAQGLVGSDGGRAVQ